MATEAYLIGVMDRTYYCPRAEEIRIRMCPRPPDKSVLLEKFTKLMHEKGLKSGLVEGKWPDKQWLIAIISTLNPEDEIFKKDYFPPPRKNNIEEQKTIQVPNAFFEGLPESRRRVKRHALRIVGEGRAKQKVQYLKAVQKEVQRQIFEQEALAERARERIKEANKEIAAMEQNEYGATEAAKVVLAYGLTELKIEEIFSFTAKGNLPSINVMKKIGLRERPELAFEHPRIPDESPVKSHIVYST
jgi:hypothetical protein